MSNYGDFTDENKVLEEEVAVPELIEDETPEETLAGETGSQAAPEEENFPEPVIEDEVPAEGEAEVPAEGEGEAPAEGEGEAPEEGEAEAPAEGETEAPAEGEGEAPAEGETEAPAEEETPVMREPKPYFERAYLLYGNEPSDSPVDAEGTLEFLKELGFDGGELRQARDGKDYAKKMNAKEEDSDKFCSYCGKAITGADYDRLRDGRLRCTSCSRTLVKSKEEMLEIYNRVIYHMDALFGASITVPIHVEMLDERRMKKKLKMSIDDIDNKSMLILGVAVWDKKSKDFSLYVENGAPRISVVATFVHELTHIWQNTHWNEKKLPKLSGGKRRIVREGMAMWVEIQYLYLIGETETAKREEEITRAREDEYGIGFLLYEDTYPLSKQTMVVGDSPFTTDRYPIL